MAFLLSKTNATVEIWLVYHKTKAKIEYSPSSSSPFSFEWHPRRTPGPLLSEPPSPDWTPVITKRLPHCMFRSPFDLFSYPTSDLRPIGLPFDHHWLRSGSETNLLLLQWRWLIGDRLPCHLRVHRHGRRLPWRVVASLPIPPSARWGHIFDEVRPIELHRRQGARAHPTFSNTPPWKHQRSSHPMSYATAIVQRTQRDFVPCWPPPDHHPSCFLSSRAGENEGPTTMTACIRTWGWRRRHQGEMSLSFPLFLLSKRVGLVWWVTG